MRQLTLYDPRTGRSMIVYERPQGMIVPQQDYPLQDVPAQYPPPAYYPPYYPPAHCEPRLRRSRAQGRENKAREFSTFLAAFVLSFIPAAMGSPGGTLVVWGLGLAFLIYRVFR
jgi:hypothetical protein